MEKNTGHGVWEILRCPYEDEELAFWMKIVLEIMCVICILSGLIHGVGYDYIAAVFIMILVFAVNIAVCTKFKKLWIDIVTFCIICLPVCYVFCHACIGYFSMMFLLIYACATVWVLGIKDSIPINTAIMLLIFACFRWGKAPNVKMRHGENIAMRFPYLFICIVLIAYCLMFMIQRYWVKKHEREQILQKRIRDEHKKLDEMSMRLMNTMVRALGAKIPGKEEHCRRVAGYATEIAYRRGLDDTVCMLVYRAGMLHEIGMIGISDELIRKKKFTAEEYKIFQAYAEKGYQIICKLQSDNANRVAQAVRYHRENYDGSGFPKGIKGEEIPLTARILAVADYTERHIRNGDSKEAVIEKLLSNTNKKFEPESVRVMVEILKEK